MKKIQLTQGQFALVDDEDYEFLMQWKWYAAEPRPGMFYAQRASTRDNGKQGVIKMHRVVSGVYDTKIIVDHIDRNSLNNQKSNLRVATASQNAQNTQKKKGATSKYFGVSWKKSHRKWHSTSGGVYVGLFDSEIEAAKAYDKKVVELYGPGAHKNFN